MNKTDKSRISDNKFCEIFLDFMRNDADLKLFYDRFDSECDNISTIIDIANAKEGLDPNLLKQLKAICAMFPKSTSATSTNAMRLAHIDRNFHSILYNMTDNKCLKEIQAAVTIADGYSTKIWLSIIRNKTHYQELCQIHSNIVNSIELKDKKGAISAMLKHFVIILPHYIQQQPKPSRNKRMPTNENFMINSLQN